MKEYKFKNKFTTGQQSIGVYLPKDIFFFSSGTRGPPGLCLPCLPLRYATD